MVSFPQGDCLSSAQVIDECGTSFSLSTDTMSACGGPCGSSCPSCGGSDYLGSNYDDDCSTECSTCSGSGPLKTCGCDINGTTENNAFWTFVPQETCDYEVEMVISNCDNGNGLQYGIFEKKNGSFTTYHAQDGGGNTGTIINQFTASANDSIVIVVDGLSGDNCDVDITVTEVNCSNCTLPVEMLSFEAERKEPRKVSIDWKTASEQESERYIIKRKCGENVSWTRIGSTKAFGTTSTSTEYFFEDGSAIPGKNCYYKLKQVDRDGSSEVYGPILAEAISFSEKDVRARYDLKGNEVGKDHNGFVIILYEDGTVKKKISK